MPTVKPWTTGPAELLEHGLSLLEEGSDAHRRFAMIAIDNSVELMLKVYLGLPKRHTGLTISRREYQEIAERFPDLLDAIEKYAPDRVAGIDLSEIEWFHRLRNQLYHQGNGLTIEREKVQVYAAIARTLFEGLFEMPAPKGVHSNRALGDFLALWSQFERLSIRHGLRFVPRSHPVDAERGTELLAQHRELSSEDVRTLRELQRHRNELVHGLREPDPGHVTPLIERLRPIVERLSAKLATPEPESAT